MRFYREDGNGGKTEQTFDQVMELREVEVRKVKN